ncbi:MAG: endolytic transglycosylase MltG, partial [Dictyoglomus sp.]
GVSADKVADLLYKNNLIKSKEVFIFNLKLLGKEKELKSGYYLLSPSYTMIQIIEILTQGKGINIKITIPEGSSLKKIADIFSQRLGISKERFINLCKDESFIGEVLREYKVYGTQVERLSTLEGYLFPSTYFFAKGTKEETLIRFLVGEFFRQITQNFPEYGNRLRVLNLSFNDWIILASIVEKEAKIERERPLIAGVFLNRLRKGYKLQSCATVEYIYDFQKPVLFYKDLEIDSPYNTYKYCGLPPSPICSPSINSLRAVLYPEGDYLFFVSKGDGSHIFSRSYEEHLKVQGYTK